MTHIPFPTSLSPRELLELLLGRQEVALLDVREARAYVAGHLGLSRMAPLSTLELEVRALVPRRTTLVILIDGGDADGPSAGAARLLGRMGYRNVRILEHGIEGWSAAGLPLIDGYGSLVKAFGDLVRQRYGTPTLRGEAVRERLASGQALALVDARPEGEYAFLSVQGAGNHAGTELALRDWSAAAAPGVPWVVNCFSRTRGIIGATTLQVLGHPDVYFLEDGVMQWALDGAPVVQNAQAAVDLAAASDEELARRAAGLIERFGLPVVDERRVRSLSEEPDRTLYVFDLRPGANGKAKAPAGARAVPGGQLLMHFENLVGTRNARVVLLDDPHCLRAAVTAFWLTQLDQAEVFICRGPWPDTALTGDVDDPPVEPDVGLPAAQLASLLEASPSGSLVVDVGPSIHFERGHLPGAHFLLPWTFEPLRAPVEAGQRIVFSSPDGRAARLAARAAREHWPDSGVTWLDGGTQRWEEAGYPLEQAWEPSQLLTPFDDDWGSVMRVSAARRDRAWAQYLDWERGVSARITADPTVRFRLF